MPNLLKIGVLASGNGSNLQAIIDSIEKKELEAKIEMVISNKQKAFALERAKNHGIESVFLEPASFDTQKRYEQKIAELFNKREVQWVVLAGYMKIISPVLLSAFPGRILNIHPSLLPAFTGLSPQVQALSYGARISGCTVHLVEEGVDTGPVIIQAAVPVLENDTTETLKKRILEKEHLVYPQVLKWISRDQIKVEGRKVTILSSPPPRGFEMINPGTQE